MPLLIFLADNNVGFSHFVIKIVAFARAFADACEHGDAAMQLGDIVDQLHDDDGFADAGAAERPDFAALQKGANQVDDLNAGGQHLRGGGLIDERRWRTMNRIIFIGFDRALFVHSIPGDVEDPAHYPLAHGHGNRRTCIFHFVSAFQTFGAGHGNGANPVISQVLLHFEGEPGRLILHLEFDFQRVVNGGQGVGKLDVHDGPDDLNDFAFIHAIEFLIPNLFSKRAAALPHGHCRAGDLEQFARDV